MAPKGTPVAGQSCKVTGGANKGKTGTYSTDDEGSLWCEGSWGGTECGSGKDSKCSAQASQVQIFEHLDNAGVLVQEVEGLIHVDGLGIFQFSTILDAATGTSRKISALPLAATSFTDLANSRSVTERRVANILASHFQAHE
jgi:hypothetical protein